MVKRLKGKVAVVTGAGRGIGRAEALALTAEGAKVVVNDLGGAPDGTGASNSPADEVVQEIRKLGGEAVANYDSVATPEGGQNIIKTAIDNFGRIDILVNNAGVFKSNMIFNTSDMDWDIIMKVHLYGTFYCTRAACIYFREQKSGRIINTSSGAGLGGVGMVSYSAAKEGIVGFTRTVARDMAKYGITCNAIRPGAATRASLDPQIIAGMEKAKAKGTLLPGSPTTLEEMQKLPPEKVASFVVFLATDEAANINGCTFYIWGSEIGIYSEPEVRRLIYKDGIWTLDELINLVPKTLAKG